MQRFLVGASIRGTDETGRSRFSSVDLEARMPMRHPLRKFRHKSGCSFNRHEDWIVTQELEGRCNRQGLCSAVSV